jgi:outer membrane immunogenic protein
MLQNVAATTIGILALSASLSAQAQAVGDSTWSGPYVGGSLGHSWHRGSSPESIRFDINGDQVFGDTVTTATGANAFAPGFCRGIANTATPAGGCRGGGSGVDWALQVGFDQQRGNLVTGVVLDGGRTNIWDGVSAFSSTPASYTMTREIDWNLAFRGRVGVARDDTLFYVTAGPAYAKLMNRFETTNAVNAFSSNRASDAWGWVAGVGADRQLNERVAVGLLYKYTRYNSGGYRVNASQGAAAADNPFVITPAGSVDFARGQHHFVNQSVVATLTYRY